MQKQRQIQQQNSFKPIIQSQAINPIEEDTQILSNIDCSCELLSFTRPTQPPRYTDQYIKKVSQQKTKESVPSSLLVHSNKKPQNKTGNCSERNSSLLISTSQDKILSPKTNYNFMQRSNSQKKTENNKSPMDNNCSDINYTNYNSNNTTCIYSSAEGYWQKREMNHKMKMDKIKNDNYQKEQNEMKDRPSISKNSQRIANHLRSKSKEQVFDRLSSGVDVRKKIEDIKMIEYKNSQNRQPMINQSSQRLQRTIDDLYQWKVQIERKKKECQTITNNTFEPIPLINHQSNDILKERKPDYLRKRVEDRLIEQGEITKIKKEEKKEHYLEKLMIPSKDDKNCYMTTCPSKRIASGNNNQRIPTNATIQQQKDSINNNYQQYDCNDNNNNNKKYIQKNKSANQSSENPTDANYRSLSGRIKFIDKDNQLNQSDKKNQMKGNYNTNNNKSTGLFQNNFTYEHHYGQENIKKQQENSYSNVIVSQDTITKQNNTSKQQSPLPNQNNNNNNNNTNLLEIRKHLNNYYEQKSQKINKSFSYHSNNNNTTTATNTTNVNNNQKNNKNNINHPSVTPLANNKTKMQQTNLTLKTNLNSNSNINANTNKKCIPNIKSASSNSNSNSKQIIQPNYQINERELEEDKIINQIPKNEPKIQCQSVLFQEESGWNPCEEDVEQQQKLLHDNNNSNISYKYKQPNEPQSYYQDRNNNNNNIHNNDSLTHDSLPPKYNFNHEIFNRFSQEGYQRSSNMNYEQQLPPQRSLYQPHQQQQHQNLYSKIHQGDIPTQPMYSRTNDIESQIITQMSNTSQLKKDNPMNKYREETSKRLQDLEQMQLFASNLRQPSAGDMIYGKKIVPNTSNIPQCHNNINIASAMSRPIINENNNFQADNLTHLNDRLKLNEKSKNYLYEKMNNQVPSYPSNNLQQQKQPQEIVQNDLLNVNIKTNDNRMMYQQPLQSQSQTPDVNSFEFQRRKY